MHSRSNPATRPRRLRSVLGLRVRFRPTYFVAHQSQGPCDPDVDAAAMKRCRFHGGDNSLMIIMRGVGAYMR